MSYTLPRTLRSFGSQTYHQVSKSQSTRYHPLNPVRQFHSHSHQSPPSPFGHAESSILSAALRHVPEHGFSNTALTLGAREAGYLDISTNLFPRGVFDLVYFHLVQERLALATRVQFGENIGNGLGAKPLGIGQRIRALCVERLRGNSEVVHRWQEALAIMAMPSNVPISISELAKLSDEMWYLAGDKSVDTNWYTKRASLSAVYASTEVFMTQDRSPDFEATWEYLNRRLKDISSITRATSEVGTYVGYTAHAAVNILRSKNVPFF